VLSIRLPHHRQTPVKGMRVAEGGAAIEPDEKSPAKPKPAGRKSFLQKGGGDTFTSTA
jgi:hypothetical protein